MSKQFEFIQYRDEMYLPDGIYNALYNREPSIIRIKDRVPVYVTHIGFLNTEGESQPSGIFDPRGILHSSVELLLPAQKPTL